MYIMNIEMFFEFFGIVLFRILLNIVNVKYKVIDILIFFFDFIGNM